MITMAQLPVLTHSDITSQYAELGVPVEKQDLQQLRIGVNLNKITAVIPRGDKAVRVVLPGQPLRIELSVKEFADIGHHCGIPFISVPVPFSEQVARQLVDKDDLSEFLPPEEKPEGEEEEVAPSVRNITMLVNALNVAHFGGVTDAVTNMCVIGLPHPLPIALPSEAVNGLLLDAVRRVENINAIRNQSNVLYNNFYDGCPTGWGRQ